MLQDVKCVSVSGGWQSVFELSGTTFGPIFNSIRDLWNWQKENIYR